MRLFTSQHPDLEPARCQSRQVRGIQCPRGRGATIRYGYHYINTPHQRCPQSAADPRLCSLVGIKEFSDWPTIPQLYIDKEFVGGCDILVSMHQDGSLAKMLEEKGVLTSLDGSSDSPVEKK